MLEGENMLQTDLLKAIGGVTKSISSVVRGTWLQLMCCALPKFLCPLFTSGVVSGDWLEVVLWTENTKGC